MTTHPQTPARANMRAWWRRLGSGEGPGLGAVLVVVGLLIVALVLDASGNALYQLSEYAEWFLTLAALAIAAEVGYWLGRRAKAQSPAAAEATQEHTQGVETAVFAVLGLLLAFTYSMAISRFDDRKAALTHEVSALEIAYERTQVLPTELQTSEAALLRQYVDVRLASARPNWYLDAALKAKTHALQEQMWSPVAAAAKQDAQSNTLQIFLESLNDVSAAQSERDAARLNHLPGSAVYILFAVSMLALGILGYRTGLGRGRSVLGTVLLVLLIATILVVILDIDQPYQGLITISQQSLIDLRDLMGRGPPPP